MNNTKEDILKINKNLDNIYNLIKKLKIDIDSNIKSDEIKEKINNTVFEIEETLKEDMNVETVEKRVLLISSKTQNVVLPYNQTDIKTFLETGKYKTQEEVIQNEYTLPLSKYKNEAISRVREGYNLARKKEKLSISESIKYALNLIYERRLHPAIITACNTTDELDIYLACLDENVTELFDFFDVVFEYPPAELLKER